MKFTSLPLLGLTAAAAASVFAPQVAALPLDANSDTASIVQAAKDAPPPRPTLMLRRHGALLTPASAPHDTSKRSDLSDEELEQQKRDGERLLEFAQLRARDATSGAAGPALPPGIEPTAGCTKCQSSLKITSASAQKYAVGTQIPTLPFKTKNSWAGNVPVSGSTISKDSSLYFFLWGKDAADAGDDLVIWLNGGPGCSSLGGMVQENGPFLYLDRRQKPFPNPYSWTKAANILYVEQPVQTGFTTGTSKNTNEDEVAAQFQSFLDNFFKAFPELASKKLWITGESYAGQYIPYITNYLYSNGNPHNLQGAIIIDGVITSEQLLQDPVAYQYAVQHQQELKFTAADLAAIKKDADPCGLSDFPDRNLHYPPQGRVPDFNRSCTPWTTFYTLASTRNPTFDVYNIDMVDPSTTSPLGNPNGGKAQYLTPTFFDNYSLQSYIHAPHKKWVECATVFSGDGDTSGPPDQTPSYQSSILANVIQKSKSFIIMQGNLDALLITNGTSLALQNLTWNGGQGFTKAPVTPLYDTDGNQGGTYTEERGLAYAQIPKSGHMIPGDTPATGLRALQKLLGQRDWNTKA